MNSEIYGTVSYNKRKYNFSFKDNIIMLQPYKMIPSWEDFRDGLREINYRAKESVNIEGETISGVYICFVDVKLSKSGRGTYRAFVPAYILGTTNNLTPLPTADEINEIIFSGKAIDDFYHPHQIIDKRQLNEEKKPYLLLRKHDEVSKSIAINGKNITYDIVSLFSNKDKNNIVILSSRMKILSKQKMKIKQIIEEYKICENLFKFIYNRSFVPFDEIALIGKTNVKDLDGIREIMIDFKLYITPPPEEKFDFPEQNFPIQLNDIIRNYDNLLGIVNESNYNCLHYPSNYQDYSYVDVNKFIEVSSAFESEFDKLYPKFKSNKTIAYKEVKNDVLDYILDKKTKSSKTREKYYTKFYELIDNLEGVLVEQLNDSFKEFSECIDDEKKRMFRIYRLSSKKDNDLAEAFSSKRNRLAHGNIDNNFTELEMVSYVLVRIIVHCLTLKRAGFMIKEITNIVKKMTS